jgi:cytochrome P450
MEGTSSSKEWVTTQIDVSGPPRLPVWGSYWFVLLKDFKYTYKAFHKLAQKYKTSVLGLFLGPIPTVVVHDYDSIRQVLTRPEFQGRVKMPVLDMRTYDKNLGAYFPPR